MILLDASVIIDIEKGNAVLLRKLYELRKTNPENIFITSIVYSEIIYGFYDRNKEIPEFITRLEILGFNKEAAQIFSKKRLELERTGKMIPLFDLMTASCAIENDAVLVTKDKHFKRVKGLKVVLI